LLLSLSLAGTNEADIIIIIMMMMMMMIVVVAAKL
jgi:hypothetical protein